MSEKKRVAMKNVVTDADQAILKEKYEFIPEKKKPATWQDRMVEKYQSGLYKEYALADMSRPGQVGLRWRTKKEVLEGVGEKTCCNKACMATARLITLRVPFAYIEQGVSKMDIVKLRLCPKCEPLVSKKNSRKDTQPSSTRAASETNEGQQTTEAAKPDAPNEKQGSQIQQENSKDAVPPHKDMNVRDKDDESEGEERSRKKKRRKKSHRSGDTRRSEHPRRR